jgi:transcriptional regulator with XRE-family HTH domain
MFDRCIGCERLGKDCVPNLMALSFPDLMNWWKKRQALLDWTNQELADKSGIPVGTINRIRKGEDDPRYSTMRSIIHALMGGHTAEFPCQKKLDAEFAHIEELEKQRQELIEERNALLAKFQTLAELHRNDMQTIRNEYIEQIDLLKANNAILREQCLRQQENT